MIYYYDVLCCTAQEIIQVSSESIYKNMLQRKQIKRTRRSCPGNEALIDFRSLPYKYQDAILEISGVPEKPDSVTQFIKEISLDMDAVHFYSIYKVNGSAIKKENQRRLVNEASILNTLKIKFKNHLKRSGTPKGKPAFWENALNVLATIKAEWDHKLPTTAKNLKLKFFAYNEVGYTALCNGNYGNQRTRKVNDNLESLLKYLFTQSWNPNYTDLHEDFADFVKGVKILVNESTGEVYNPADYTPISVSTVRNYMSKWRNAVGTEKKRSNSRINYNKKHRSAASLVVDYAGSILSMDDRDIPLPLKGTKKRVVGYFTADVCSGAIIGWAFARPKMRENDSHGKGMNLIMDCFRNTFEQLEHYNVNMPAEVEVENHLMSTLKDTILKPGNLFQFVRYAGAENPQEKSIEGFFRNLRYKYDRKIEGFRARPHARAEANQSRPGEEKVEYSFEEICEICIDNITKYNNSLHPDENRFPEKTRIQVFLENQNPKLLPIHRNEVARWVGKSVITSVNRGEVKANSKKFILPSPEFMDKTGIGSECIAYWLTDDFIYLYKNDEFVCELGLKPKFHKAKIEQTSEDFKAMSLMRSFTKKIDDHANKIVKDLKNNKIVVLKKESIDNAIQMSKTVQVVEVPELIPIQYQNTAQQTYKNDLLNDL